MSFAIVSSLERLEQAIDNPINAVKRTIESDSLCMRMEPPQSVNGLDMNEPGFPV
jgi:hypothetical protein